MRTLLVITIMAVMATAAEVKSPVATIKFPKKINNLSYKGKLMADGGLFSINHPKQGSVFSYSVNGKNGSPKTIRDYVFESDSIRILEETFIDHLTETILSKLASQMKSGVPSLSIPPLDPLRLKTIKVEPHIGADVFTIQLNDIEVDGLSEVEIQDLRPKLNALKVRLSLLFPKLTTKCHFTVNGSLYGVIDVGGEGDAVMEYTEVLVRTQLNLIHENNTFQIGSSDPPLVDFAGSQIKLLKEGEEDQNRTEKNSGVASELGPLLFWVLADHVVQEVSDYLLKYVNNNMLLFKVPDSFTPIVTWFLNRSGTAGAGTGNGFAAHHLHSPFHGGRFSPFPFLNQWLNSLSNFRPQMSVHTRLFK